MAKAKLYGGRWKVSRPLSAGGQGDVYLVQDSTGVHEGQWVLKRLRNSERLGRFAHEIKALERLQSVRVPKVVDHSLGEPAFLVYKQVGDETLDSACRRYPLGLERSLRIFEQVVEATVDAHKLEIAHRDIKPNNVCITSDFMHAFLIDFGICQLVDSQLILTATDEPLGNALFAAPECSPGSDLPPGLHSDVYSLGKLLFWMTSAGGHIHREDISPSIVSKIVHSSEVVKFHVGRLLHGCINADPAHRWTSAELLEMTLEVKQTIDELAAREKRGLFTVWDGLGLNGSFNSSSSRSVTRKPRGNPPDDYEFALRFLVPGDV